MLASALQELYLRKNYVTDIMELTYLQPLRDLRVLWLCDNPCAEVTSVWCLTACH